MIRRQWALMAATAALGLFLAAPTHAANVQIDPAYNGVKICDAVVKTRCLTVAADGSIATTGSSGGSLSAKANAAAQTSSEGATTDPLSMDLHRSLRVMSVDSSGAVIDPNAALPTGTNTIGNVGLAAGATGGCTPGGAASAASTNATSVKASAGTFCGGLVINTTATIYYLRLYNLAAAPTCSSATGFVTTVPIPASTSGAGTLLNFGPFGAAFSTGIAYCLTGGGTSTDNTSAATGVYLSYATK